MAVVSFSLSILFDHYRYVFLKEFWSSAPGILTNLAVLKTCPRDKLTPNGTLGVKSEPVSSEKKRLMSHCVLLKKQDVCPL
jgi:hypothetical protein